MEENNNNERKNICFENHCWKKCLAMIIAAFIGGFLAFYFVADQMMYRYNHYYFNPKKFEKRLFDDMERSYKHDLKSFDKIMKKYNMPKMKTNDLNMPFFMMDSVKIKTELEDNNFEIIIDLKPFQYDENKVNYNIKGRKLTVFGQSMVKDSDMEQDISFSQDFILPINADIENIQKIKDGKKLIIQIPLKEEMADSNNDD